MHDYSSYERGLWCYQQHRFGGRRRIGGTYTIKLTTALAIIAYLPDGGTPTVLNKNYINPLSTVAGEFATQVSALKLNVDASTRGYTKPGLANLKVGSGKLAGYTVTQ